MTINEKLDAILNGNNDQIVNALKSRGVNPTSNNIIDIVNAINTIVLDTKHTVAINITHGNSGDYNAIVSVDGSAVGNSGWTYNNWNFSRAV